MSKSVYSEIFKVTVSFVENIVQALEKYLGRVKIITGSLKIARSFPLISLDFFKSLKEIQGIYTDDSGNRKVAYALEILENENLQKLFPTVTNGSIVQIQSRRGKNGVPSKGRAFIHYNPKLCKSEIDKLLEKSNMIQPPATEDISYATNGDKAVCSSNKLKLEPEVNSDKEVILHFTNYQEVIDSKYKDDYRRLLKYEIHYREITKAIFDARHDPKRRLTKYNGRDACGGDEWIIMDHRPQEPKVEKDNNSNNSTRLVWVNENSFFVSKPYTYYAVFVTTMILKEHNMKDIGGAESEIVYVLTPESDPSYPINIGLKQLNFSSINITWSPPVHPNGIIDHYEIYLKYQKQNTERILQRRFCDLDKEDVVEKTLNPVKNNTSKNPAVAPNGHCDCSSCPSDSETQKPSAQKISKGKKLEEDEFHDTLLNYMFPNQKYVGEERKKRSVIVEGSTENLPHDILNFDDLDEDLASIQPQWKTEKGKADHGTREVYLSYHTKVKGTKNHVVVTDLQHFAGYSLKIKACHQERNDGKKRTKRCSQIIQREVRTLPRAGADDIVGELRASNSQNDTGSVFITWNPPPDPNMLIVKYNIVVRSTQDLANKKSTEKDKDERGSSPQMFQCLNAKKFNEEGGFKFSTHPGSYYIKVQAVSLSGKGTFTASKFVMVEDEGDQLTMIILVVVSILVVFAFVAFAIWWLKWRNNDDLIKPNMEYQKTVRAV